MQIHRLTAFHIPVSLKRPVRHASHSRTETQTLLFRCVLKDGSTGWGEGLPRTYVTGESIDTAWQILDATSFEQLAEEQFADAHAAAVLCDRFPFAEIPAVTGATRRACFGNSVRAALELSILDAACHSERCSLSTVIHRLCPHHTIPEPLPVAYSGVITGESASSQRKAAFLMRMSGLPAIKLKVGLGDASDTESLRRVRRWAGSGMDIRLDANEAWQPEQVQEKVRPLLPFRPSCLEQPVPHSAAATLKDVRTNLGIPVMLDESLCCREDADLAVAEQRCDFFNIRLSKCGGILRSLQLVEVAEKHSLGWQLGCQVGETGILSAAGRHFAGSVRGFRYAEGSYDRFLLRQNITEQDLTFGYGGRGNPLAGPGLGIDVNECLVREIALRQLDVIGD